MIYFTSDRSH